MQIDEEEIRRVGEEGLVVTPRARLSHRATVPRCSDALLHADRVALLTRKPLPM